MDRSYFCDDSFQTENAADCILDVREQFSINQYTGGSVFENVASTCLIVCYVLSVFLFLLELDFKNRKKTPEVRRDSLGYRIPDDDPIKFHLLTEEEASDVLYKCIIDVHGNSND